MGRRRRVNKGVSIVGDDPGTGDRPMVLTFDKPHCFDGRQAPLSPH